MFVVIKTFYFFIQTPMSASDLDLNNLMPIKRTLKVLFKTFSKMDRLP